MRLINTETLRFEEFRDDPPGYAILSHRWAAEAAEEALYPGFNEQLNVDKPGYQKASSFCEVARMRGHLHAWVDTCCINKSDAAELSEALNSMGLWYQRAAVCIVYLADVSSSADSEDAFMQLEKSSWFRRGWTLQELLMSRRLVFYSASWDRLGALDKDEALHVAGNRAPWSLSPPRRGFLTSLERASNITIKDLCITDNYKSASTAQRMFWASRRQTMRIEDESYSLMALFDIWMPLVYGEGRQAFQRLQARS